MRFSIVFIHRNNFESLRRAIDSVYKFIKKNDEIILVDNNSSDNSINRLRKLHYFKELKIIKNKCNRGYAYGCNQGISLSSGEFIILCNNDIWFQDNILEKILVTFNSHNDVGLIGPKIFDARGTVVKSYSTQEINFLSQLDLGLKIFHKSNKCFDISEVKLLRGPLLALRKSLVNDIGAMDEEFFFYHEETEWCSRIFMSKKWKMLYDPRIAIYHYGGLSTSSNLLGSRIEFFRSRMVFWKKVFPIHKRILILFINIPKLFIDLIFYFLLSSLTLFAKKKYVFKLKDRFYVICWLMIGKPDSWGLPDKCKVINH